jgi:TonB family protein
MDYGGAGVYIKSSAMLLVTCLIAAMTAFPADTAKKRSAKVPATKDNNLVISPDREDIITCFPEDVPVFPGGEKALVAYLKKNIKYPAAALKAGVSGTVFVQFTVKKTGHVCKVHPLGPYKGYGMEAEAIRVICNMPKWKPAKMDGKYTDVLFHIPIRFILPK